MPGAQAQHRQTLQFDDNNLLSLLCGELNANILTIAQSSGAKLDQRGANINITGMEHEVALASSALSKLYELIRAGYPVYPADVAYAVRVLETSPGTTLKDIFLDKVYINADNRVVSPKSINQKLYIDNLRNRDIVFGIGPAGTGKTYLAVASAVAALQNKQVKNIILTRPAVEAGERLGFLPGDLAQKVNPYLRPLYDALNDMLGKTKASELIEDGTIEIAPLAFMRGRTLSKAYIILDEAQNATCEQMKMFLTRLGFDSKAVITGDITQTDLPADKRSGLIEALRLLSDVKGIAFSHFDENDVVRHPLVQQIISAYQRKKR